MTSPADMDALIAALHPHVRRGLFNNVLYADNSLKPSRNCSLTLALLDSFAVLLGHYPGCHSVAIIAQAPEPGRTSLNICPSPSIQDGFHSNTREWLALFSAMRAEYAEDVPREDAFSLDGSETMKRFVLHTHRLCYPAMRHRAMSWGLYEWELLIDVPKPQTDLGPASLEPTEVEKRLREELADDLRHLSELVQAFVQAVSRETVGDDEDVLRLYALCAAIRNAFQINAALLRFFNEYMHIEGTDCVLRYLHIQHAVSTLIALSRNLKLVFDDRCSIVVLDPSLGGRPFSATVTETHLAAWFGAVPGIQWQYVVQAFYKSVAVNRMALYGRGRGLEWNEQERLLSSSPPGRPVVVHPEVALIQHLLENSMAESVGTALGETKGYIACSEVPCYASVRYAGAVNAALQTGFTMRTHHPDWCRLDSVALWVLPHDIHQEVMDALKETLLQDLSRLRYRRLMW